MNVPHRLPRWVLALPGLRGMFNLNDPRWGRGEEGANSARPIRMIGQRLRPLHPHRGGVVPRALVAGNPRTWMNCGAI